MVPRGGALLARRLNLLEQRGKASYPTQPQRLAVGSFSPKGPPLSTSAAIHWFRHRASTGHTASTWPLGVSCRSPAPASLFEGRRRYGWPYGRASTPILRPKLNGRMNLRLQNEDGRRDRGRAGVPDQGAERAGGQLPHKCDAGDPGRGEGN